jgi:acyl dehydratase
MNYYDLPLNYEFPSSSFTLDQDVVSKYLAATRDTHTLFAREGYVPPMAVGALAVSALSKEVSFPPGTVHVSQEFEFAAPLRVGAQVSCRSKVTRNLHRGGLYLMSIEILVLDAKQQKVLTGKVGFVLPEPVL